MKRLSILLAAMLILTITSAALAQDEGEEKDILEVNLIGGLAIPSGGLSDFGDSLGAESGWRAGLDIGYFVKPNMTVGFNFTYSQFGVDATDGAAQLNHRLYNPNLYVKYLFEGETNLVPYVRGHFGIENPKLTTFVEHDDGNRYREKSYGPSIAYGLTLGLFYYTADYSGLFAEVQYHKADAKSSTASYGGKDYEFGESLSVIGIQGGIRILVGSDE